MQYTTRVLEHLFATAGSDKVYAVLDAARDPQVYVKIMAAGANAECLYDGQLPHALAEVAPYLVELRAGERFGEELVHDGWGRSWGAFITTPETRRELRRHLRRFLRVQTEDGQKLIFRYYDPRVLCRYLPTCTDSELVTFFGPISSYLSETDAGATLMTFTRTARSFGLTRLSLLDA